jgi:hypothetical protein
MLVDGNASVYGGPADTLDEGRPGSLVVYESTTAFDALRTQRPRPLVLRDGRPVARSRASSTVFRGGDDTTVDFGR